MKILYNPDFNPQNEEESEKALRDMDLYVGLLYEKPINDGLLGPTNQSGLQLFDVITIEKDTI